MVERDIVRQALAPTGKLRAGINMSNFLLVSEQDSSDQPAGLSPTLAQKLAEALEVECVLIPFESPGLLADEAGKDVWDIANIAVESERAQTIAFSQPYIHIDANFFIRADAPFTANAQVNARDVEIILYGRSAYDLWLKEHYHLPSFLRLKSMQESLDQFYQGQGDVLACLKPRLIEELKTHPGYRILTPPFTAIKQAIGVAKHHQHVMPFLNDFVQSLLETGQISDLCAAFGVADKLSLPH